MKRTLDKHPALAVKSAVLARSGVYTYSYQDMLERGHKPKIKKDFYTEYRPKEVLLQNKDKFKFATVSVEHTNEQTNEYNFHDPGQVSGVVGNTIGIEDLPDGEVALVGDIALYTKDAVDFLNSGRHETSADYSSRVVESPIPKYDYVMVAIGEVNSVAITEAGRGGPLVRVRDSVKRANRESHQDPLEKIGGIDMDIFKALGITRTKDSEFKLSKLVLDGIKEAGKVDRAKNGGVDFTAALNEQRAKIAPVLSRVTDSVGRSELASLINGVLNAPSADILANEERVAKGIDGLFDKYRTKDAENLQRTLDEIMKGDKPETDEEKAARIKKEEEDKNRTKDSATVAYVDQKFKEFGESMPGLLAAAVAQITGIAPKEKRTTDSNGKTDAEKLAAELELLVGGGSGDDRTLDSLENLGGDDFDLLHTF